MILFLLIWGLLVGEAASITDPFRHLPLVHDELPVLFPQYISHNLGQYAPFFPIEPYIAAPLKCEITQVNMLYRHGARSPTSSSAAQIQKTLGKFKVATTLSRKLRSIKDYAWTFGNANLLPYGAKEAISAGKTDLRRYHHLLFARNGSAITPPPFIRATQSQRVVDTATNWAFGLLAAAKIPLNLPQPLVISEDPQTNNTLDNSNCPGLNETIADVAQTTFLSHFAPPITARLNSEAPGANLTDLDTVNLFFMCAFDSLLRENESSFCPLFDAKEYRSFEYYQDLGKYYTTGYGNPLGPVQGVGYVNELVARLTSQPVASVTNVNRTLDADPVTFPLSRRVYADFSHDNQMAPIYAALGIHKPSAPLPTDRIVDSPWVASRLVPFAARFVVEKYSCENSDANGRTASSEWVRILNNDKVIDVPGCANDRAGGLCELGAFIDTLQYALNGAADDWAKCIQNDV